LSTDDLMSDWTGFGLSGPEAVSQTHARPDVPDGDEVIIGGLEFEKVLGRGGTADVYLGLQRSLGREVAIKRSIDRGGISRRRFLAEAQVTAILDHGAIVPIHDLLELPEGDPALVMKLVRGDPWDRVLSQGRPLVQELDVLMRVAQAVAFAHHKGVLHLDLKPANVMVSAFGEVLLMDWGCAAVLDESTRERMPLVPLASELDAAFGTPAYMPPEQAVGDGARIGITTDVYLLGSILHRILAGQPPHRRATLNESLMAVMSGKLPELPEGTPPPLAELRDDAMKARHDQRIPNVETFMRRLDSWLEHRKSEELSRNALVTLRLLERQSEPTEALYVDMEAALGGFEQALRLWPENPAAVDGRQRARQAIIDLALRRGDLGLAEAHAARLQDEGARAMGLQQVHSKKLEREDLRQQERRHTLTLWAAVGALFLAMGLGAVRVVGARGDAEESRDLARERLEGLQQLSDVQRVRDQQSLDDALWPALPEHVADMRTWVRDSEALIAALPRHRDALARLQGVEGAEAAWERATLTELVASLETLRDHDLAAMNDRIAFATTVEERTLEAHSAAWDRAIAEAAENPAYQGYTLVPQLGLVPLGADPESGLQEFGHLASGSLPSRNEQGQLSVFDGMGIVLVLVPGGTFTMGASPETDPSARDFEGPPHQVTLKPFFLGKYELTQDQWLRAAGSNPSAYPPGFEQGGRTHTSLHPVEQVRHAEALRELEKLGLTLPTEAQWEYASRAGSDTIYWTGDDIAGLDGFVNLADQTVSEDGPGSWVYEPDLEDGYVLHGPVGGRGANPFGLHDTVGNVWEWCLDPFGPYTVPPDEGTGARDHGTDAPQLFRGGGFRANRAHARSADRYGLYAEGYRAYDVGVRAALNAGVEEESH
jgi:formylglycine-generating enzyme required for sulfatase activity